MYRVAFILFVSILFVGCTSSSLRLDKKELLFNYNSNSFLLSNTVLEHTSLNYKDLFVNQYKLEDNKERVLFYEEAKTTLDFEFNFGGLYTVLYIFDDAQEYELFYTQNNFKLIQLKLKNSNYVNILIQASDTQSISYVYGFSNKEFSNLAKNLTKDSTQELKPLKYKAKVLNKSQKPLTNWNDKMVYFTPLTTPFRLSIGR